MSNSRYLVDWDSLPSQDGIDHVSWSLFSDNGKRKDGLGTLNLITDEVVKEAAKEIQTGRHVHLNLPLTQPEFTYFGRKPLKHERVELRKGIVFDDHITYMNTQSSTQWDGHQHCSHLKKGIYYGGVTHEDILADKDTGLGTDVWVRNGGIATRGVLLDHLRWAEKQGKKPLQYNQRDLVTLDELKQVAEAQKVSFKPGDILFVRSGFGRWLLTAPAEERKAHADLGHDVKHVGVEASLDTVKWVWNNHFSAVAGDAIAFEGYPFDLDTVCLHDHFLTRLGVPIGELFYLEDLSKVCEELGRWSFFFTSMPLHIPKGVASPPNAMAIF